jgi:hypothetical protein
MTIFHILSKKLNGKYLVITGYVATVILFYGIMQLLVFFHTREINSEAKREI